MVPNFKLYCKAIVIKTVWDWHEKQTHQSIEQNREPRNNSCMYGQLTYDKEVKNIQWGKTVSSISGAGKTGQPHVKE